MELMGNLWTYGLMGDTLESPLPAGLSPAFRGRSPAILNMADCPKLLVVSILKALSASNWRIS